MNHCICLTALVLAAGLPQLSWAQDEAAAEGELPADAPITKLPTLKRGVQAIFPEEALRDRVAGKVVLAIDIGADGYVENVEPLETTTVAESLLTSTSTLGGTATSSMAMTNTSTKGDYGFATAAIVAAAQLEFTPAESNGTPVPVRISYTFNFALPAIVPPTPPPSLTSSTATTAPAAGPGIVNFKGTIRERGSRSLLAGVVVTIFQGEGENARGYEAFTNDDGDFEFRDLPPGKWKVLAEIDGYFPARDVEEVRANEVTEVTYYIEKGGYNEYAVTVNAKRVRKEVNRVTLSSREIERIPGTLGDPILVVENLPGVARPAPGSGQIIVRGSGPNDTGVFVDGIQVPLIYHFGGLRSVLPASVIEDVDFYPGNYSVYYGRFTGGIFDAHIKKLNPDRFHGSLDVNLLDTALYLEAPITDELSVAIAGRRSYIDLVLNAAVPDDASVALTTAPRYYDYQAFANWRPAAAHEVRGIFLGSDDRLELLFENPSDFSPNVQANNLSATTKFQRGIIEYRYAPSESFRNYAEFAIGNDVISFAFGDQFRFDLNLLQFQFRDAADWKINEMLSLRGGVDAIVRRFDILVKLPGSAPREGDPTVSMDPTDVTFTEINGENTFFIAPFVEATIGLFDQRLLLIPGLRLDYFGDAKSFGLDPRLAARFKIDDQWTVKGGVGLTHQEPQPFELDENFGTPGLGLQRAVQYSLGGEWTPLEHIKFDVTFFYKDLQNFVSNSPIANVRFDNNGRGRVYGAEVFLQHKFTNNFKGWLTYTLSRAERLDSGSNRWRKFDFDQTHILNMILGYTFPENWEVGLRWRLVSGNPETPFVDGVYSNKLDQYVPVPGEINSSRLPFFHQLDLRIDKSWIFDWWRFSAYLSLINTYNRRNTEGFDYNFDYSSREPIAGLPILPVLGVKAEF